MYKLFVSSAGAPAFRDANFRILDGDDYDSIGHWCCSTSVEHSSPSPPSPWSTHACTNEQNRKEKRKTQNETRRKTVLHTTSLMVIIRLSSQNTG